MDFHTIANHYRGLLALNTLGVKLLELGQFLQAKDTFSEAILEIKAALGFIDKADRTTSNCAPCHEKVELADRISQKVKVAEQAASVPFKETGKCNAVEALTQSAYGTTKITIPNWKDCGTTLCSKVFPIRLEVLSLEASPRQGFLLKTHLDLESAVILHNMYVQARSRSPSHAYCPRGVSLILVAKQSSPVHQRGELINGAYVFRLSHTILRTLEEDSSSRTDVELMNTVFQIESVVLVSMIPVLRTLGQEKEAEDYYHRLSFVMSVLDDFKRRVQALFERVSSSAAAA